MTIFRRIRDSELRSSETNLIKVGFQYTARRLFGGRDALLSAEIPILVRWRARCTMLFSRWCMSLQVLRLRFLAHPAGAVMSPALFFALAAAWWCPGHGRFCLLMDTP